MSNWSGNGSTLVRGASTLHLRRATLTKGSRLTENTSSASASASYIQVVKDHSWSVEIPWDDTNLPDTDFGINEGDIVTLVFAKGSSGKSSTLTNTTVERLEDVMDNEGDIIRTMASGRGGVLTREVT